MSRISQDYALFSGWNIINANIARVKTKASMYKSKRQKEINTFTSSLPIGFLSDLVPPTILAISSFFTLIYLAKISQLYVDPSLSDLVYEVTSYIINPWLSLAVNIISPLALVFLAPLFKDVAIWTENSIVRKTRSKSLVRLIRLTTKTSEYLIEGALTPIILVIAVFARDVFVEFITSPIAPFIIWTLEVVFRRWRRDICPASSTLISIAVVLRLGKALSYSPPIAVLHRIMQPSWKALGISVNTTLSTNHLFPEYFKTNDPSSWAVIPGCLIAFSTVTAATHIVERVLSWHVQLHRPARIKRAQITLESDLLWFMATIVKTLIWWLWRTTSLTSIAICVLQFYLFGQVRTLIPTIIFAVVEMGGVLISEIQSRRAEITLNNRIVTTVNGEPINNWRRKRTTLDNLQVGDTVILSPGEETPGTVVLIQPTIKTKEGLRYSTLHSTQYNEQNRNTSEQSTSEQSIPEQNIPKRSIPERSITERSTKFAINTVSIDGETGEKMKNCIISTKNNSILETIMRAVTLGENPGIAVAKMKEIQLQPNGYPGPASADKHLAKHSSIVRQGAMLAHTSSSEVTALIIGFNSYSPNSQLQNMVDEFLRCLSHLHTYLLAIFTTITVLTCWLLSGVSPIKQPKIVIELALANNVCLLMTLVSITGTVLELLITKIPGINFGSTGKRSLIALSEAFAYAKAKFGNNSIIGVHLSDKTGTITCNEMTLQSTVLPYVTEDELDSIESKWRYISPNIESIDNSILAKIHIAITTNRPESPKVVPEETAYSSGLNVQLISIDNTRTEGRSSLWETVHYSWHNQPQQPITRLTLGLSYRFRVVASLVTGPLLHLKEGETGLVVQGAPEAFQVYSNKLERHQFKLVNKVTFPPLEETAKQCQDSGAQRNWVMAIAQEVLKQDEIDQIEKIICQLDHNPSDGSKRDEWLAKYSFIPIRMMILVDRYRSGVENVPLACAKRGMSFWMVTGDGLANAKAIAQALNLPRTSVWLDGNYEDDIEFVENLITKISKYVATQTRITLYLGVEEQSCLTQLVKQISDTTTVTEEVARLAKMLRQIDTARQPLIQVVCYNSERDLKQGLVEFCQKILKVATIFTGDGKNDIGALQTAHLGIAFPGITREDGGTEHDPEVYLAGSIRSNIAFWEGYKHENSTLLRWGSILWSQLWTTSVLLILKQSGTAGINVAASAATGFSDNGDPYHPALYLLMSNIVAFGLIISCSVLAIRQSSHNDVTSGIQRLTPFPLLFWAVISWITGMILYQISRSIISNPLYQADGALILLVVCISVLGVILATVDLRRIRVFQSLS